MSKMCEDLKLLKQGAEAKLFICNYLGKPTLIKERFKKNYRHPDLDCSITKERIKNEARSILRCMLADVRTPTLYLVDFDRRRIYMEHFENSITVKDFIIKVVAKKKEASDKPLNFVAKMIGEAVRKMHENNIIHGDLTTSNMLLVAKTSNAEYVETLWRIYNKMEFVMIDFGLSYIDQGSEEKGVDLYVLERAVNSTHSDFPKLFDNILDYYKGSKNNTKEILSKFDEVRARGRKRTMVG